MGSQFEPPDRALIDLRDERDDLSIRLSLLKDDRLTPPAVLSRLKQDIEELERRIAKYSRARDA
jgi:hypothetical protein